ncbi:MAG TPA: S8/S53 family peptidase, partial [Myxococcota bacterium]|nr:S8/S53 family peptidase [Myxococcota bacterium]
MTLALLLALAACRAPCGARERCPTDGDPIRADTDDLAPTYDPRAPDLSPAHLPGEPVLRVARGEACPDLDGATLRERVLGRYCRYQAPDGWTPPAGSPERLGSDALAISPACVLGDGVDEPCDDVQAYWLASMTYASGWAQADACPACRVRDVVPRLELLDSLPDTGTSPVQPLTGAGTVAPDATTTHGMSMYRVAARSTCGASGAICPVEIRARQVLGLAPDRGGNAGQWGSFLDLAAGIEAAVDDWLDDRGVTFTEEGLGDALPGGSRAYTVGPLVLNLSLGWHPAFGGGPPDALVIDAEGALVPRLDGSEVPFSWSTVDLDALPLGVQAVFDALVYARCHGALVFAATGNSTSGPLGTDGPILPAAWEALPTQRLPACDAVRRADAQDLPPIDPDLPLVVAIGSLAPSPDARGEVVEAPFARPRSRPTFLAYGYEGVSGQVSGGHVMQPLSGTSMSSAIAASTVALVMAIREVHEPLAALRLLAGPVPDPGEGDSLQYQYQQERDRHDPGMPVSPVFQSESDRYGTSGACVWLRACGYLLTDGWACTAIDSWPETPGVVPTVADWGEVTALDLADADEDGEALYSPSVSPTIQSQPDWPLCPECMLVRDVGRLVLDFPIPAGALRRVNLVPDAGSAAAPRAMTLPLDALEPGAGRLTLDALVRPIERVQAARTLRVDLIVEAEDATRRTSRM